VKSGTIFDNFLVTDDVETAKEWAVKSLARQEGEKELKKKADEERRAKSKDEAPTSDDANDDDDDSGIDDLDLEDLGDLAGAPETADSTHDEL